MSMTYYSLEAFGLLINGEEAEVFKKNYIKNNPDEFKKYSDEEKLDVVDEWIATNDLLQFDVCRIDDDRCCGVCFYPLFSEENNFCPDGYRDIYNPLVYVFMADKQCTPDNVFNGTFYDSPDEVLNEIKGKLGKYLPHDFPYKDRIGTITCAEFC